MVIRQKRKEKRFNRGAKIPETTIYYACPIFVLICCCLNVEFLPTDMLGEDNVITYSAV